MRYSWTAAVALVLLVPVDSSRSAAAEEDFRRPKKLIATGWDHLGPEGLRENMAEVESRPFDGVVIPVVGQTPEGQAMPLSWAFRADGWQREWFEPAVQTLRNCRSGKLTDNFVLLNANPGDVDWFDDQGWADIVDHCRIAAWVARQAGVKGILFDPEPYAAPHAAFRYAAQPQRDQHSFADYYAQARRRGGEMMAAMADEFPDITLLCYFMNSVVAHAAGAADPRPALRSSGYGLYPALIDGWLDAAPPSVRFVDGCESAYRYNSTPEFLEAAVAIKGRCQELVSPENRAKYRAQVQVSFGIYLDAYWNPESSPWYIDGLGGSRVDRLRINTATALRVADEYVWIYGEKFRWWPTDNRRVQAQTWPEAMPGSEAALAYARDPLGFARQQVAAAAEEGRLVNLAVNGDFAAAEVPSAPGAVSRWAEGRPPAGWASWQEEDSRGEFRWDREIGSGSARACGVAGGCFLQAQPAEPGQRYAVGARVRTRGRGEAMIRVRWQTAEWRWTSESRDQLLYPLPGNEDWREIFGVVEVPPAAGQLVILLGVRAQASADDVAWFDDVRLHQLP